MSYEIPRHKVFISYYHADDQYYKNKLIEMKEINFSKMEWQSIFEDCSVHEDEIDDTGMTDEQIRCEIRDNYIQNATVLILLCGENTRKRKHIDWEIHAAMYDSEINPKMGILVINLPQSSQSMIACGEDEEKIMGENINWVPLKKDISEIEEKYPYLPDRIKTNIAREGVSISVVNWDVVSNNTRKLKELIDKAFDRRKTNQYDHSAPLRRRNS